VTEPQPGDVAGDGLNQLQAAALDAITAARALLDVAEQLVRDPAVAATVVSTAASLGRAVLQRPASAADGETV
jgi:hypothetical protein